MEQSERESRNGQPMYAVAGSRTSTSGCTFWCDEITMSSNALRCTLHIDVTSFFRMCWVLVRTESAQYRYSESFADSECRGKNDCIEFAC